MIAVTTSLVLVGRCSSRRRRAERDPDFTGPHVEENRYQPSSASRTVRGRASRKASITLSCTLRESWRKSNPQRPFEHSIAGCRWSVDVDVVVAGGALGQRFGARGDVVRQHDATAGQHVLQRAEPVLVVAPPLGRCGLPARDPGDQRRLELRPGEQRPPRTG